MTDTLLERLRTMASRLDDDTDAGPTTNAIIGLLEDAATELAPSNTDRAVLADQGVPDLVQELGRRIDGSLPADAPWVRPLLERCRTAIVTRRPT